MRGWVRGWVRSADGRAVLVLVAIPLVVFVGPALFGHTAIAGDNFLQNFPLRVLVGRMLGSGHLPLWNPYLWSGTPLLGGLNAGAFYPGTLLFAVLPPLVAWVINLLMVYWAAGLGTYALLRQFRVRSVAALLGGATYAFAGTMTGQMVHLPIVQGMSWIPLMVLAQIRLAWVVLGVGPTTVEAGGAGRIEVSAPGSPWRWVVLLGASIGMIFLAGEPRGMGEVEIVAGTVGVWMLARRYPGVVVSLRRRAAYLGWSVLAAGWAVALAAIQLLPGWDFISASQRASENYSFFAAGSLAPSWSVLWLVPDLFGGDGIFHQPVYFNSYNLSEVTGYVGLLPLVAFVALGLRAVGRRRDHRAPDWTLWLGLAVLGALLAMGADTVFGPVFGHIPFFDKLRLQSRSLAITDLAGAMLLGFWVDAMIDGRLAARWGQVTTAGGRAGRGLATWAGRVTTAATLLPSACTVALCVVAIAVPFQLETYFGTDPVGAALGARMVPWLVLQGVLALAVVAVVLARRRLGADWWRRLAVGVVVVDLAFFAVSSSTGLTGGNAEAQPSRAQAAAILGTTGRFAIYDTSAINLDQLSDIGAPDINVLTRLSSVQGYGSLVSGDYDAVTGSHFLDTLDPCAVEGGVFTPLRLATLLIDAKYLTRQLGPLGLTRPVPPACVGVPAPGTTHQRTLYFGQALILQSVALAGTFRGSTAARRTPRVGVMAVGGQVRFPRTTAVRDATGWRVSFARPQPAAALVVRGPARAVSDATIVTTVNHEYFECNGIMQPAMDRPGWTPTGFWSPYARFQRPVGPPVWVVGGPTQLPGGVEGSTVTQRSLSDAGTEVDRLNSPQTAVTVVRSEAYQPGWRVVAAPTGGHGATLNLKVVPRGLVQAVRVPAGRWQLTFLYRPTDLNAGLAGSALALLALGVVAVVAIVRRRHRAMARADQERRVPSSP